MSEEEKFSPQAGAEGEASTGSQPAGEKFRELADLEAEIRRRLRSNQRFLEKFLDEDFVDDEMVADEGDVGDDEEL